MALSWPRNTAQVDAFEVDTNALPDVLKWAAGGFTLLTGVLAFLGVKEGAVDRLIRASAWETMVIFALVGLGVLLAIIAPVLKETSTVGLHWILGSGAIVVILSGLVLGRDLGTPVQQQWSVQGGLVAVGLWLGLLAFLFRRNVHVPWGLGMAALSLTLIACGVYHAAKVAVLDKLDIVGASIEADLAVADGSQSLSVRANGKDVVGPLRITVEGLRPGEHLVLSSHVLRPDRMDSLDATLVVPVNGKTWDELRVVACQDPQAEGEPPCLPRDVFARFPLYRSPAAVGAWLSVDSKGTTLTYSLSAQGLSPTTHVKATVRVGAKVVSTARLTPDADGKVSWTGTSTSTAKQSWTVTTERCDGGSTPANCGTADTLATLTT